MHDSIKPKAVIALYAMGGNLLASTIYSDIINQSNLHTLISPSTLADSTIHPSQNPDLPPRARNARPSSILRVSVPTEHKA